MLSIIKRSLAASSIFLSAAVFAAPATISFSNVSDGGYAFNEFSVTQSGITVDVSGWADTARFVSGGPDDKIKQAYDLDKYKGGWSMQNLDEKNGSNCGYSHSADNLYCGNSTDYDFFLLEFSEEVSLTSATYSWRYGNTNQNQVSVAALSGNTLLNNSWQGVKDNLTIASDSAQMTWSSGYYTGFNGTNVDGVMSTTWLIGALNEVFGTNSGDSLNNDGMKLSTVNFNTRDNIPSVPEPSSIVLFGLACLGLFSARKKQLS